jgi:hypothetical protein
MVSIMALLGMMMRVTKKASMIEEQVEDIDKPGLGEG